MPRKQDVPGVGFNLDGANGSPSDDVAAEYSSTSAREKCQLIHFSPFYYIKSSGSGCGVIARAVGFAVPSCFPKGSGGLRDVLYFPEKHCLVQLFLLCHCSPFFCSRFLASLSPSRLYREMNFSVTARRFFRQATRSAAEMSPCFNQAKSPSSSRAVLSAF